MPALFEKLFRSTQELAAETQECWRAFVDSMAENDEHYQYREVRALLDEFQNA